MALKNFEDFALGERFVYGGYRLGLDELLEFSRLYDPQPFHLDEAAARHTMLGGLAASGWQGCSILMRMMIDSWILDAAIIAGVGIKQNRWLSPLRPGARLEAATTVAEKFAARARPDAGMIVFDTILRDVDAGVEVLSQSLTLLISRKNPAGADEVPPPRRAIPAALEPIDDVVAALPEEFSKIRVGARAELGKTLFSAELIRSYAEKYDPAPFHVDEVAGKAHAFGALSAAGLHVASCWMGHFIAARKAHGPFENRASPGFTDLYWRRPVLVGDEIAFSTQVVAKRETSKPGLGLATSRNQGVNQHGEVALDFHAAVFVPIAR